MRRVVVTGLGLVAPTGNCVRSAWDSALACRSGVARITAFDPSDLPVQIGAEVKRFDPSTVMTAKQARQTTQFIQFAAGAAHQAVQDSGLDTTCQPERHGCCVGVGLGGSGFIERESHALRDKGARRVSPLLVPYAIPSMAAGFLSIALNLKGPSLGTTTACASGTHAIGEAFLHIALGMADVMVAGGSEGATSPLLVAAFARMRALSPRNDDPTGASRPFDLNRDGFVMGEGSGIVVLEDLDTAKRRGARIYAELVGYAATTDAHHITNPTPGGEGAARCLAGVLKAGHLAPDDVDYINAHGTSTQANDAAESAAIGSVFGSHAAGLSISSTKGVTGHCLGGAGGIEAVYTVLALYHCVVPPTANYQTPDPACPLDYTPNQPCERRIRAAVSNSFGFGGHNACIAFRRFE